MTQRRGVADPPPPLEPGHWYYRYGYVALGRFLSRYHRTRVTGAELPIGPCIFVAHHGAGYLNLDLVVAGYELAWRSWHERRGSAVPFRIAASRDHALERFVPGLRMAKRHAGLIEPSHEACLAVLERGEQLLITPGGGRESRPEARDYRLRWANRFGFVRLALLTGAPIVPLAVVGGFDAYPGRSVGKLTFWTPVPVPARLDIVVGTPLPVARCPDGARDPKVVEPIHVRAWRATQSLYDGLLTHRGRRPASG